MSAKVVAIHLVAVDQSIASEGGLFHSGRALFLMICGVFRGPTGVGADTWRVSASLPALQSLELRYLRRCII